ncbi:MAG: hypothetical protein QOG76_157, partial [Pseudonocardiales bacterium]|nr:hypothetical protein [Pseudonocardiales bacterium]
RQPQVTAVPDLVPRQRIDVRAGHGPVPAVDRRAATPPTAGQHHGGDGEQREQPRAQRFAILAIMPPYCRWDPAITKAVNLMLITSR